jgi:hypothetical protein
MTRNPIINAFSATLYIVMVVLIVFYGPRLVGETETILIPIAMLSLFVLSAAMMGYLFLSQPLQLYLSGKRQEAINLFLKTLGTFALVTILIFVTLFFVSRVSM